MKRAKHRKEKRKSKSKKIGLTLLLLIVLCLAAGGTAIYFRPFLLQDLLAKIQFSGSSSSSATKGSSSSESSQSDLPKVSSTDWNLILVNRDNQQEEKTPNLTQIGEVQVDSRIAENTRHFLAAAQAIAPEETLISGYRSRAEQEELYNEKVAGEVAKGLSNEEAVSIVLKQVQLPGASEHQTGLAIDMSVPEGQEDELAAKIAQLAPSMALSFAIRMARVTLPELTSRIGIIAMSVWRMPSICRSIIWFWKNISPYSRQRGNKKLSQVFLAFFMLIYQNVGL